VTTNSKERAASYAQVDFKYCVERGKFTISPGGVMSGGHPWMRMMCR
jgi:hypothetical protein